MNQSNKALREAAIRKLRNADHAKCYEPAWHRDTADILIALVTNHIKGRMPEKIDGVPRSRDTHAQVHKKAYNQALDEVHQLLEEVSNADQ